jgi:hypothetical protein
MVDENFARRDALVSDADIDMSDTACDSEPEWEESEAQKHYPYADAEDEEAFRRAEEREAQERREREAEDREGNEDEDE